MRVMILSLNYVPEPVGIGPYSHGWAVALAAAGHDVTVVAAHPYYPRWRRPPGTSWGWTRAYEDGVDVVRCPIYVPARPNGWRRIVHYVSFAVSALVPVLVGVVRSRPDRVVAIAPALLAAPVAWLAARLARARLLIHVQDFEVEAAFATGMIAGTSRAARLARRFERWMFARADRVTSISAQMCARLIEKGVPPDRVAELRNWAETDAIRPLAGPSSYRDRWQLGGKIVALYSGNIAMKQGVGIIVEAARLLAARDDIVFMVCGEGPNRAALDALATDLPNLRLADLQPRAALGDLLGLADIHLLPQIAGAADLVLPSKLANMLASGRAVVATADPATGIALEVAGSGRITPPGDVAAFAAAIAALADDPAERTALAAAARRRAEQYWSRSAIFARCLETLVGEP